MAPDIVNRCYFMMYIFCLFCKYIEQRPEPEITSWCSRCQEFDLLRLTTDEVVAAFESGDVAFCKTCGIDHSTSLAVRRD